MEILVQCRSDVALKISYLDYNEIRAIIESQSKLKGILSDSPKFTLSYKISGEVIDTSWTRSFYLTYLEIIRLCSVRVTYLSMNLLNVSNAEIRS